MCYFLFLSLFLSFSNSCFLTFPTSLFLPREKRTRYSSFSPSLLLIHRPQEVRSSSSFFFFLFLRQTLPGFLSSSLTNILPFHSVSLSLSPVLFLSFLSTLRTSISFSLHRKETLVFLLSFLTSSLLPSFFLFFY